MNASAFPCSDGSSRPVFRSSFFASCLLITTLTGFSSEAAEGEVIHLPDFTVTGTPELPPPESWQYARLEDGTEVLSNASERATRRLLRDFQIFQQALEVAWPSSLPADRPARTLILCGRRAKFEDFVAADHDQVEIGSTSLFVRNREQAAIIVDLQASTLNLAGLVDDEGAIATRFEVDPYKQLYREYVRYLLSQASRPPPPWLQEGLAQIVMDMEFTPQWIIFGKVNEGYEGAPTDLPEAQAAEPGAAGLMASIGDRPFTVALRRRALIPMEKFFAVTADSPEALNPLGNNRWAKQAYAFVHLCLYGENGRYREAFAEFVRRTGTEPVSEALFKECFRTDYKGMLINLRGYISFTNHTYQTYKLKPGSKPLGGEPIVLRDATQAEVGRIKGDAQRLAGRTDRALASYRVAYARGERDLALLGSLGVAENQHGQPERARPFLEAAAKGPVQRPSVLVELARARFAVAKAAPAGPNGRLDDAQMGLVFEPLFKARQLQPALPETYDLIAEAWLLSTTLPKPEQLGVLVEGIRAFPRNNIQFHRLAELYIRIGDQTTAAGLAQIGLRLAPDPAAKTKFEHLLAGLPPAPTPPR